MVVNEVYHMLTTTTSIIVLSLSKTFISCHICSMRMKKVLSSFSKVKNCIKCC